MARDRKVLLHLLELGCRDLCIGVFLPVHHTRLQRSKHIRKGHRGGVCTVFLEHLDAPFAIGRAQFDPLQVLGQIDWPDVVGDMPEPIFRKPYDVIPVVVCGSLERVHHGILNAAHMVAVFDDVGHFKNTEQPINRGHHRRGQRKVYLTQLELLQQFLVIAQLRRAKGLNLCLATGFFAHAGGEMVCCCLKQRARFAHMAKPHGDICRHRGHRHKRRHYGCNYCFFHCLPPLVFVSARAVPRLGLSLLCNHYSWSGKAPLPSRTDNVRLRRGRFRTSGPKDPSPPVRPRPGAAHPHRAGPFPRPQGCRSASDH